MDQFFQLYMFCRFLGSATTAVGTDPSATGEWSITCPLSTQAVPLVWSRCCVTLKSLPCLCICLVMIYYMSRLRMLNLQCVQWSLGRVLLEYNPLRNHSVPLHGLNYSLSEEESVIGNDHIWSLSEEESISAGASEDADEDVRISWAHRVKGLRHTCDLVHISTFLASFHFSRASRCHVSTWSKAFILMALMFSCQTVKFTKQFVCMYIPVDSGWQKNWWSGAVDPRSVQA